MLLLIDNYDSFTYNLARYFVELGIAVKVVANDAISIDEIKALQPSHICLSPGPCTPNESGICLAVVQQLHNDYPILGVCLGHQTIIQAFGGQIIRAPQVMHGKLSTLTHNGKGLFAGCQQPLTVTRYHSLVAAPASIPDCFEVTARVTGEETIMAVAHKTLPIYGVQFHPESHLSVDGHLLLQNFLVN